MTYFLDTNICIYYLTGRYPGVFAKLMQCAPNDIKIPAIVKAELLHGAEKSLLRDENLSRIAAFLLPFEIVPFDDEAATRYGKIKTALEKLGMLIGPNDLLIAASVLAHNATLVTNNIAEFSRIDGIRLENWIS